MWAPKERKKKINCKNSIKKSEQKIGRILCTHDEFASKQQSNEQTLFSFKAAISNVLMKMIVYVF